MRVYVLKLNFTHVLLLAVFLLLTFSVYHEGSNP